jgi:Predicted metal-dependent hydrolase
MNDLIERMYLGYHNKVTFRFRFAYNDFESGEHIGTHVDAPYHIVESSWKLGGIPQERFFAPGKYVF